MKTMYYIISSTGAISIMRFEDAFEAYEYAFHLNRISTGIKWNVREILVPKF